MSNLRIPPRQDFDVPEQVYEWFRTLSTSIQKIETNTLEAEVDTATPMFKGVIDKLSDLESQIDTFSALSGKIKKLEDKLNSIDDDSLLPLVKLSELEKKLLTVNTYEYKGTLANGVTTDTISITKVDVLHAECIVETTSTSSTSANTTSELDGTGDNVILNRDTATASLEYVIKVKEYKNG